MISTMELLSQEILAAATHLQALARSMTRIIELADLVDAELTKSTVSAPLIQPTPSTEDHIHLMDFPRAVKITCDIPGCSWTE